MRDRGGVPELCNNAAAGCMDGIGDTSPSADMLLRPEAWCIGPAKSFRANRGGFGDDQSRRSTLRIILRLQDRGHVIMWLGTHPGERRHDDAVRKIEASHAIWCEERLIRHHMNSYIREADTSFFRPRGLRVCVVSGIHSAIHCEIRPCNVRGLRARDERHHRGDLIHVPIAVEGCCGLLWYRPI